MVRLGHDAVVVSYVGEVPESMGVDDIDAVIAAIESETIGGLELAAEIATRAPGLPIAFTAGRVVDASLLFQASQVGPVLPSRWTSGDVQRLIEALSARTHSSFAEGTPQPRRRKVNVSCSCWEKVARLCSGRARICVRGNYVLENGDRVRVALSLPDEITLSVDARVIERRNDASYIELTGLDDELSDSLLGLARERGNAK